MDLAKTFGSDFLSQNINTCFSILSILNKLKLKLKLFLRLLSVYFYMIILSLLAIDLFRSLQTPISSRYSKKLLFIIVPRVQWSFG